MDVNAVRSDWDFAKPGTTLISVTEVNIKLLFELTRHLAIGGSSFTSIWIGVPAPPSFAITHSEAGPGLDWDFGERSLRFASAGVVVSVGF